MKKSEKTKGLTGSVDYIDSDELATLRNKNLALERQLAEANRTIERMKENERERYKSASKAFGILPPSERQLSTQERYKLEQLKEKGE